MSDLEWMRPELWWWGLLLIPIAVLVWLEARRRARVGRAFGVVRVRRKAAWATATIWSLVLLGCFVAVLEPLYGEEKEEVSLRGIDVVVCLDVSRSMLAEDLEPTRLERARQDVASLLQELRPGDRVALVAFGGQARVVSPLTVDRDSVARLLGDVNIDTMPVGGTDLAAALRRGLALVEAAGGERRSSAILLLTDGEDLAGAGRDAARDAADRGVVVHTVGYGTVSGGMVPLDDGRKLRDERGQVVVSTLDADGLRRVASVAGGEFLRADAFALPLVELVEKRLLPMERREFGNRESTRRTTRYQWALVPALILLLLQVLRAGGRRP